jgi:hypothetical protein
MSISGGSAKRQWHLFFVTYCMVFFFPEKYFLLHGRFQDSHFFRKLFILFTEISLKSRVCLKDTPPKLKASSSEPPNGGFRIETALHGRFGSETAKFLAAVYLTEILQRTQMSVRV